MINIGRDGGQKPGRRGIALTPAFARTAMKLPPQRCYRAALLLVTDFVRRAVALAAGPNWFAVTVINNNAFTHRAGRSRQR